MGESFPFMCIGGELGTANHGPKDSIMMPELFWFQSKIVVLPSTELASILTSESQADHYLS